MKGTLFFDLDECLMTSIEQFDDYTDDNAYNIHVGNTTYMSFKNDTMINFLNASRIYYDCYLLTSSSKLYANIHNVVLNLGFKANEIFTKEDMKDSIPIVLEQENTFLIDNMEIDSISSKEKIKFLNLKKSNYIQVSTYMNTVKDSEKDVEMLINRLL